MSLRTILPDLDLAPEEAGVMTALDIRAAESGFGSYTERYRWANKLAERISSLLGQISEDPSAPQNYIISSFGEMHSDVFSQMPLRPLGVDDQLEFYTGVLLEFPSEKLEAIEASLNEAEAQLGV